MARRQNVDKAIRSEIEETIQGVIDNDWLSSRGKSDVQATLLPTFGMSNALVYRVNVNVELFAKYHAKEAQKEIEGYKLLHRSSEQFAEHLLTPLSMTLPNIWLTPFAHATTLHELVYRPHTSFHLAEWIKEVYTDFLQETTGLWKKTQASVSPNLKNIIYRDRVMKSIREMEQGLHIKDFWGVKIKINSQAPIAFGDLIDTFMKCLQEANVSLACTTHGDEHAKNIMVDNEAQGSNPTRWIIIDYVNAKNKADWILSVARMLLWWELSGVLEQAKDDLNLQQALGGTRKFDKKSNQLIVEYNEIILQKELPNLCSELKKLALTYAQEVASNFGEEAHNWNRRLQLAKFALLFSFASSQSLKKVDFTVPIMIGESLKHLIISQLP